MKIITCLILFLASSFAHSELTGMDLYLTPMKASYSQRIWIRATLLDTTQQIVGHGKAQAISGAYEDSFNDLEKRISSSRLFIINQDVIVENPNLEKTAGDEAILVYSATVIANIISRGPINSESRKITSIQALLKTSDEKTVLYLNESVEHQDLSIESDLIKVQGQLLNQLRSIISEPDKAIFPSEYSFELRLNTGTRTEILSLSEKQFRIAIDQKPKSFLSRLIGRLSKRNLECEDRLIR